MKKLITFRWRGTLLQWVADYVFIDNQNLTLVDRMPSGTIRSTFYSNIELVSLVTLLEPAALLNAMQTQCHLMGEEWQEPPRKDIHHR